MESILKKRASENLFYVCLLATPLWLAWITFDFIFAYDLAFMFLPIRIGGAMFSLLIIYLLKKTEIPLWKLQSLMFMYYNIGIGYMLVVVDKEVLYIYFHGFSMVMMVMFFILILNYLELIIFSFTTVITFALILIFNPADVLFIMGNGGYVFLTILLVMIAIGILKYKGAMRDARIASRIQKAKEIEELNISLEQSLKEKENLLQEIHHRVKNNLQIISSILSLQNTYVRDSATKEILTESISRIKSMSGIHEILYKSKNFDAINFSDYLIELIDKVIHTYNKNPNLKIDVVADASKLSLNIQQAIPCGLIVNEIITNTVKYAFNNQQTGKVFLTLKEINNQIYLTLGDNGVGLADDFVIEDAESLGLQLVESLVEQLDGSMEVERQKGIYFKFVLPKK